MNVWLCLTRSRLTEERALSRLQLMLVHSPFLRRLARPLLPKGWTASSFKTSGEVDSQRVELRTLGTRLAVLSIISFLCKSTSVAASYFARDQIAASAQLESVIFLATTFAVQAVPSAVTLLLLSRFNFSSGGVLMQSLLTREGAPVEASSNSAAADARQGQQVTELEAEVSRLQAEVQLKAKAEETAQQQRVHVAKLKRANLRSQEEIAQLRLQVPVPTCFMVLSDVDSSSPQLQQQQQQQPSKV